jgi:hypothetical protein
MDTICRWFFCIFVFSVLQGCATAPPDSALTRSLDSASDQKEHPVRVIDLGAQAIPACHEVNQPPGKSLCVFAPLEDPSLDEHKFRTDVAKETDWSKEEDAIGVALSGGGTRAAANAMGVLAGLDDLGLLTYVKTDKKKKVELISSVSGGGYAAYYLYSRLLHPAGLPVERGELFQDCVKRFNETGKVAGPEGETPDKEPYATSALVKALGPFMCKSDTYFKDSTNPQSAWEGDGQHAQARHQAALRCQQDVMSPGKCSSRVTSQDGLATVGSIASLAAMSWLTRWPHHAANSLFDSGLNLSPSRAVYSHGIDLSYGGLISREFRPSFLEEGILNKKNLRRATRAQITCPKNQVGSVFTYANYNLHECDERHSYPKPRTWTLEDFAKSLNEKRQEQMTLEALPTDQRPLQVRNHPYWVIQATSAPTRGLAGWLFREVNRKDAWNNSFEFTPTHFGSRRYGFVPGTPAHYEVIDAVASAAAFLDANQQAYDNFVVRPVLAAFQHGINLNWGIDLPNYNTTPQRRRLHQVLPFPLNNVDAAVTWATNRGAQKDRLISSFIRLTDGGNAENTGVLAMVRRGVRNIVVADAASDDEGSFGDLCHLKQALNPADPASPLPGGQRLHLYLPGLAGFDEACESGGRPASFDLKQWSHSLPLLLGCIQNVKANNSKRPCANPEHVTSRLFIYKPAITYTAWKSASPGRRIDRCKVIRYSPLAAPEAVLLQGAAAPLACSGATVSGNHPEDLPSCMNALPCEAARLVRNGSKDFPTGEDAFISSTVAITANSSGTLYASYRELARHAVHGARHVLLRDSEVFHKELQEQRENPMPALKR